MRLLKQTLTTPAKNLALDEALIDRAEANEYHPEVLRLWEPKDPFVVIGRSSSYAREVNVDYCRQHNIPVLRRVTGGAAIVTGPGCLMYGVLLDYRRRPELRMLDQAHQFVMQKMADAIRCVGVEVDIEGICDLTIDHRKVSGNSLRCKRNWMLYHGTMICDFDRSLIGKCLDWPKRIPDYRVGRTHDDFVGRIPVDSDRLAAAIAQTWAAEETLASWPKTLTERLANEKYETQQWTLKVA
jgi:lipoate-protein ligase A